MVEALGVSVDMLRFYEKAGLADPPPRDGGGRRRYGDDDVGWLESLVPPALTDGLAVVDVEIADHERIEAGPAPLAHAHQEEVPA